MLCKCSGNVLIGYIHVLILWYFFTLRKVWKAASLMPEVCINLILVFDQGRTCKGGVFEETPKFFSAKDNTFPSFHAVGNGRLLAYLNQSMTSSCLPIHLKRLPRHQDRAQMVISPSTTPALIYLYTLAVSPFDYDSLPISFQSGIAFFL